MRAGACARCSTTDAADMDGAQLSERMHAVLDGEATPEERRELEVRLAEDAAARSEFESLRAMFASLAALPEADPPRDLTARIAAALPSEIPIQLSPQLHVIAARPERKQGILSSLSSFVRWLITTDNPQESGTMDTNQKIWVGGAVAAAALGIAVFALDLPPKSENVLGTVVPAERYRAPQAGAEAVKLGPTTTVPGTPGADSASTGFDAERVRAEIKSAEARVAELKMADKAAADRNAKADADRLAAERLAAERTRAELKSAELRLADLRAVELRAAEIKAAEAKVAELKTAERMEADRTRAQRVRAELASAERQVADLRATQMKAAERLSAERSLNRVEADRMQADKVSAERSKSQ